MKAIYVVLKVLTDGSFSHEFIQSVFDEYSLAIEEKEKLTRIFSSDEKKKNLEFFGTTCSFKISIFHLNESRTSIDKK